LIRRQKYGIYHETRQLLQRPLHLSGRARQELRQVGELSHQRGGNEPKETNRTRTGNGNIPDSIHRDGGRVPHGLAAQAVQQTQVGTQDLRIQPFHHPEPHYPLYRQHGDAKTQALPHGEPLYDPEQNALRFVYRGKEAGTDRKAEAAVPIRHDDPRGSSAAGNSVPVCRGMGYSCQKPCSCGQPQEVHAGAHHLDGGGNAGGSGQHGGPYPASGSPPHTGGRTARRRDRRSDPGRSRF